MRTLKTNLTSGLGPTDGRDHSILNVLDTIRRKSYVIGVVRMEACNHSTFRLAILKCVAEGELPFDR